MSAIETFTSTQQVPLADCDGKPIKEGCVLRHTKDGETGVVTRVIRAGDTHGPMGPAVGDMLLRMRQNVTRVSCQYSQWQRVPHAEQTYEQRFLAWALTPYNNACDHISDDTALAISGVMSLLPEDMVDWNYTGYPETLEAALDLLAQHLTQLTTKEK